MSILKRFFTVLISIMFCISLTVNTTVAAQGNAIAQGIDVSVYQGDVDWEAVRASGIDYVILRVGTGKGKDVNFENNYIGAKQAGLDVGCYYYTYATSIEGAEADAIKVLSWIEGKQFEYPIYYDIESNSQTLTATEHATEMCITFIDVLSQNGWYAGVYCNEEWLVAYLDRELLMQVTEIWYARWTSSGEPDRDYAQYGMWQYTDSGRCNGIDGYVDRDVCYKDYPTIIKSGGYNGFEKEKPDFKPSEESGFYIEDGFLFGVSAGMTVEELLLKAEFPFEVTLYDKNGAEVSSGLITTGTTVSADFGESCKVIVKGDTDGSGTINSADFMQIRRAFLGLYTLENEYFKAADTDGNGAIGSTDFMQIRRHFLGIFNMYEN